jgi:hypothetical protein
MTCTSLELPNLAKGARTKFEQMAQASLRIRFHHSDCRAPDPFGSVKFDAE